MNHYHQRSQVAKKNREKLQNGQQSIWVHGPQIQVQKQGTDTPIIEIPSPPHLEHEVQFLSPNLRRDIRKIEKIQRRATKIIPEIRNPATTSESRTLISSALYKEDCEDNYLNV